MKPVSPKLEVSPRAIEEALQSAKAELFKEQLRLPEMRLAAARDYMRGSKGGDAGTAAGRMREDHLRNVIAGLEALAAQAEEAELVVAIADQQTIDEDVDQWLPRLLCGDFSAIRSVAADDLKTMSSYDTSIALRDEVTRAYGARATARERLAELNCRLEEIRRNWAVAS
jgi:hypothetical protein